MKKGLILIMVMLLVVSCVGCEQEEVKDSAKGKFEDYFEPTTTLAPVEIPRGNRVGNLCYDYDLTIYESDDTISVSDCKGKVTILYFWYLYLSPCIKNIQTDFSLLKEEYGDQLEILAIHSFQEYNSDIPAFIAENFSGVDVTFCRDGEDEAYFSMMGGNQAWPITVILDEEGVIAGNILGSVSYEELKIVIDGILS
jgi:hypothetical protein